MQATKFIQRVSLRISLATTLIAFDLSWLVIIPASLWAILNLYIPIFGSFLSLLESWTVALLIVLLVGVSLIGHLGAHFFMARLTRSARPETLALLLFGDTAQSWTAAETAWREFWVSLSGPLGNLIVAGLAYWIWNAQLNPLLNLSMLFTCGFNLWLAAINLIPAMPFDGGRLVRVFFWGIATRPQAGSRLAVRLGDWIALALTGWGVFLATQRARFSLQTSAVTIAFALLILVGLRTQPTWEWDRPEPNGRLTSRHWLRSIVAGLCLMILLLSSTALLLTNDGLDAPGPALAVEPMVIAPAAHSFPQKGSFILTTVITQAPITAGEWLVGQLTPAVKIVPPEVIVPDNTTPQQVARQGYQMLDESEATAIIVGLRRAGFKVEAIGKGVEVMSITPDSHANGLLQPGDVITALNGSPIQTTNDLINRVRQQGNNTSVQLQVERNSQVLNLTVPLMPASGPDEFPKIGITIASAGFSTKLPFLVKIEPQKIAGGPSAGLMFALTVYNTVTPQDLTQGWKIAGTGTISLDGSVGPIGGVEQKVVAAEMAGAAYFLAPPENYAAARSVAKHIQVVEIANFDQAVQFLQSLPPH